MAVLIKRASSIGSFARVMAEPTIITSGLRATYCPMVLLLIPQPRKYASGLHAVSLPSNLQSADVLPPVDRPRYARRDVLRLQLPARGYVWVGHQRKSYQ